MTLINFFIVYPFFYSLLEWTVHRLLHLFNSRRHRRHHIVLKSKNDYTANLEKVLTVLILAFPFFLVDLNVLSLWLNYTTYEFFHSWVHRNKGGAASYHTIHHFSKDWRKNYGVLSPFWDKIFGTMRTGHTVAWWKFLYNWNPYLFFINF